MTQIDANVIDSIIIPNYLDSDFESDSKRKKICIS